MRRESADILRSPANAVTLVRAILTGIVTVLVVQSFRDGQGRKALPPLTIAALVLDAVDGPVARGTHSVSAFGARFDGEVDAWLIAVLSLHVSRRFGPFPIVAGAARYAFGAAGWLWPWLRRPLPYRYWRKVATATEGIALAAASTDVLPRSISRLAVALGSGLIAESFGRDIRWLWTRRADAGDESQRGA